MSVKKILQRFLPAGQASALLFEIFDRARTDPDLTRPALLLCSAYDERVARMLDQDPLHTEDLGPIRAAPRKTRALSLTRISEASLFGDLLISSAVVDLAF